MRSLRFLTLPANLCLLAVAAATMAQPGPDHLVVGAGPPGGDPLQLFSSGDLLGASGHGPSVAPGSIIPIVRVPLTSLYTQPRYGGYSFSTTGYSDLGLDYAAAPHDLSLTKLNPPPPNFYVALQRLSYDRPAEFAIYTPFGAPRMVEDNDEYQFGNAFDGGHVHPLLLLRRPGLVQWNMRFTSDAWQASDAYTYHFTSVPGRGTLVPINMAAAFNADVVDSDGTDSPLPFDSAGHCWLLNGHYGSSAGLPVDGRLCGFELGGPGGGGLQGSNLNVLLDDGVRSLAAAIDLTATGQADQYLSVEFLLAGAGSFTTSDVVNITLVYADATTKAVAIRQGTSSYLPYRMIDDWQQTAMPRPWLAVGRQGDRNAGFARSTGAGVDTAAGEVFFFFRATTPTDHTRTLTQIAISDYAGSNRVGLFAILAVRKAPLEITTVSLPEAREGEAYSFALAAEGTPPYHNWQAVNLPAGLVLDSDTGVLSGTPDPGSAAGSPYSVEISVEDSIHLYDAAWPIETHSVVLPLAVRPAELPGDVNGDGVVDLADVPVFIAVLLGAETTPEYVARSDLDQNNLVDGRDIRPFVEVFLLGL